MAGGRVNWVQWWRCVALLVAIAATPAFALDVTLQESGDLVTLANGLLTATISKSKRNRAL